MAEKIIKFVTKKKKITGEWGRNISASQIKLLSIGFKFVFKKKNK